MKYFNIPSIQAAIHRIVQGNITHEHRTGTAGTELTRHYFPTGPFVITPEQFQPVTGRKPDLAVEAFRDGIFTPHTFIEFKSLVNSNISNITHQLYHTLSETIDYYGNTTGNFSAFLVAMKGTKIAFYMFHHFSSLLDEYNIDNYNGIIPLTYLIPDSQLSEFNGLYSLLTDSYKNSINFNTDSWTLRQMGVLATSEIPHPHIFDLLDPSHQEDIHKIFRFMATYDANWIFAD